MNLNLVVFEWNTRRKWQDESNTESGKGRGEWVESRQMKEELNFLQVIYHCMERVLFYNLIILLL